MASMCRGYARLSTRARREAPGPAGRTDLAPPGSGRIRRAATRSTLHAPWTMHDSRVSRPITCARDSGESAIGRTLSHACVYLECVYLEVTDGRLRAETRAGCAQLNECEAIGANRRPEAEAQAPPRRSRSPCRPRNPRATRPSSRRGGEALQR